MDPVSADDRRPFRRAAPALMVAVVVGLTELAFSPFLTTGFGATDSLPLVVTSRFANPAEALQQFAQPVMAGTRFVQGEVVYRPLPSMSLGVDHLVWGMNPFGYHLTNLILHGAAVVSVWAVLLGLGLRAVTAAAGAALFGLHPLVVATVPVIARRDSILPVLATTAAAALLLAADRPCARRRRVLFGLAVMCVGAALLSKESAFAGLILVVGLVLAARLARGRTLRHALRGARGLLPLAIVFAVVFGLRWSVVRGLGGGSEAASLFPPDSDKYSQTIGAFTRDLAWVAAGAASSTREIWPRLAALVLVGLLVSSMALGRRHGVLLVAGSTWVVAFAVFAALLKIGTIAWLAYFALVGLALVFAAGVEGALLRLRSAERHHRVSDVLCAALVTGLVGYVLATLSVSPLVRHYDQWAIAGEVTDAFSSALTGCLETSPRATRVVVQDLPSTFEDGRVETNLMGVTLIEQYTVDAILSAAFPARDLETSIDGYETLRRGAQTISYTCAPIASDTVRLIAHY